MDKLNLDQAMRKLKSGEQLQYAGMNDKPVWVKCLVVGLGIDMLFGYGEEKIIANSKWLPNGWSSVEEFLLTGDIVTQ